MTADPTHAPARPDLTFLRARSRPKQEPPPAKPAAAAARSGSAIDYTHRDRARPSTSAAQPAAPAAPAASGGGSLDLSAPAASAPTPTPTSTPGSTSAPAPAAPSGGGSLDLSQPSGSGIDYTHRRAGGSPPAGTAGNTGSAGSAASGSLDLSDPGPTTSSTPAPPSPAGPSSTAPAPHGHALPVRDDVHVSGQMQQLMSVSQPTVTLTRTQSGIGELSAEAVCSPEVGDLRLGAFYQLRNGDSGVVQLSGGNRFGPSSRRPVVAGSRDEYERVGIDLRQVTDIERVGIYAFSESRADLRWGGTLVVTLFGGARIETPLESLYPGRVAMLASVYNIDGELVVRSEMETVGGDIREVARAYGYDRITWRDERSPVD